MPVLTAEMSAFWSVDSAERARDERVSLHQPAEVWNDEHQARVLAEMLRGVEVKPATTVLDYGCGVGRVSRALALAGASVLAVDVSPAMLRYTAEYCAGLERVACLLCDGYGCRALPDACADGAVSVYCFQHMPRLDMAAAVLRDIRRIVAPGGWFHLQSVDHGDDRPITEVGFDGCRQPLLTMLNLAHECGWSIARVACPLADDGTVQYSMLLRAR